MRLRAPVAAIALSGALAVGATTTSALAQDDDSPAAAGGRGDFICAHLEQIEQLQSDLAALLEGRLALLQEARQAAEQAEKERAVRRIDRRIDRTTNRQTRLVGRQEKLAQFAAENC